MLEQAKKEKKEIGDGRRREEEKPEKKGHPHEKRIIGLLLAFPKEGSRQIEKIRLDFFSGKKEKSILSAMIEGKGDYGPDKIKSIFSDHEIGRLIDEAIFEAEVEAESRAESQRFFDPALELKASLERLKKNYIKERIIEITQNIKEAERAGDRETVKILVNEFQDLASGIEI